MFKFSTKIEKAKELISQVDEYYLQYDTFKKVTEDKDKYDIQIYNYYEGRVTLPDDLNRELTEIIELKLLERISELVGEIEARLK